MFVVFERLQSTCATNAHHSLARLSAGYGGAGTDMVPFLFVLDVTLSKPIVSEKRAQHTTASRDRDRSTKYFADDTM